MSKIVCLTLLTLFLCLLPLQFDPALAKDGHEPITLNEIFHDQGDLFCYPAEPSADDPVVVDCAYSKTR